MFAIANVRPMSHDAKPVAVHPQSILNAFLHLSLPEQFRYVATMLEREELGLAKLFAIRALMTLDAIRLAPSPGPTTAITDVPQNALAARVGGPGACLTCNLSGAESFRSGFDLAIAKIKSGHHNADAARTLASHLAAKESSS